MGKSILIFLLGSMVIFGTFNLYNNQNLKNSLQSSISYYGDTQARDIGNTMMQMIFSQLADSNSWRVPSSATFTGYGAILVTGSVALSGGNKLTTQDPQGSALGLYIVGNLAMSGNSEIDANMIVLGSIAMSGTPNIIGSIITPNPIALSGNAQVDYKPPVSAITQPFWAIASRPSDIRYYLE